jgi:hypothetical protein
MFIPEGEIPQRNRHGISGWWTPGPAASGLRRQSAFRLLRRRRNITTPNKTAIAAQMMRRVVVSIPKISFPFLIG